MKKTLSAVLMLLLTMVAVFAVGTKEVVVEKAEFVPSLDTEKEVILHIQGGWDNFEALDAVEQAFNKYYPNVHISYQKCSDVNVTIENLCPAGELDLFFSTKAASSWAEGTSGELYSKYMLDLNETDIDLSGINANSLVCGQYEGKQYGFHVYEDFFGLIVNTDLLSQNGFDVPMSYEEFIAICDAFAQKSEDEHANLIYGKQQGRILVSFIYANIIRSENRDALVAAVNNAENVPAELYENIVEMYDSWVEKGYFNSACSTLADSYNAAIIEFFNGKAPFLSGTVGTFSGCAKREAVGVSTYSEHPFSYTFIPVPNGSGDDSVILSSTLGMFSICKTSKNLDYAIEFLRFLVRTENMETLSLVKGMPSTNISVQNPSFAAYSNFKSENVYSLSSIGLSSTAYKKLQDSAEGLLKDAHTAQTLVEYYAKKMGK